MAMLTPLVYIPQTIFAAVFGKMIYFQIVIELIFPFFLYLMIFHKDFRPKINRLSKLILVFFGIFFLSSLLGVDWSRSFWGNDERMRGLFGLLHFLAIYFYIITVFRTPEDKKKLFMSMLVVGILVAIYGIAEKINPELNIIGVGLKGSSSHRVMSTMGNPIFLAGYMIFACFLSLYYYFQYKDYSRWLGLGGFFLSALVILFTGTRGAFLGLMGGLAAIAVLLFFNTTKKKKIIIASLASAFVLLLILVFTADVKILKQNKYWNFSRLADISLKNADGSANGRILLWQSALKAFKERPLLGWGAENFDYAFDKYYNPQFYRGGINETWSDRAHNWFLDFLVMGGIPGLASYLAIFICAGILFAKKPNRTKSDLAFAALFSAFLIHSFFAVDDPSTTMMLFVSFAFMSLLFNEKINDGKIMSANRKNNIVLFIVFYIFIFLSVYFFNIKPLCAGIDFISFRHEKNFEQKKILAEKFLSSASPYGDYFRFRFATEAFLDATNAKDKNYAGWALDRAVKEMGIVLGHHPVDYSYFHTLGNVYLIKGSMLQDAKLLDVAIGVYKKALQMSPKRQAAMFQLSTAYLFRGYTGEAVKILKEAVASDEKVGQSHWRLGVALLADMKRDEAYLSFKNSISRGFFDKIENEMKQVVALCAQFEDYNCAIDVYKVLIERSAAPDADFYAQLAAAYGAAGRYEEAKEAVKKAVELDPALEAEARIFLKQIGF